MKTITKFVLVIIVLLSFVSSNANENQKNLWKGKIECENGTKVIKNPEEPLYSEDIFELEEELSIGEAEGKEEYMFSLVRSIAVDNEERIYILDRKEFNVRVLWMLLILCG